MSRHNFLFCYPVILPFLFVYHWHNRLALKFRHDIGHGRLMIVSCVSYIVTNYGNETLPLKMRIHICFR